MFELLRLELQRLSYKIGLRLEIFGFGEALFQSLSQVVLEMEAAVGKDSRSLGLLGAVPDWENEPLMTS